jgi:hypothetical protein
MLKQFTANKGIIQMPVFDFSARMLLIKNPSHPK